MRRRFADDLYPKRETAAGQSVELVAGSSWGVRWYAPTERVINLDYKLPAIAAR